MKSLILFLLMVGCSKNYSKVQSISHEEYKTQNKVAVLSVEFDANALESDSLMEQIKKQFDYTNEITEAERERGILRVSDRYNNEIKKTELRTKEILSKLENKIINRMNALLLSKKLIPLERSEIVKLLKESSLYQTGLFDNEKNIQIGKLATADLIMLSKIEVKVSGAYVRNYEVTLTGKLVSVKDGRILAIGEVFVEDETLDEKLINQVVDKWFENIPDGSKLFLLF
ncbi:CsgG/HfaB family protein [Leptospira adleri]|uniref:Curli assembly protein CsgG n=1 Tax=Leptospira adleri TaxID=2023186 RepID=A0A2M9YJW1_9LEPT|nr:CsgG/HfaB family protein [Leptospira adleri]PJZ51835.1 hypothetical protein CH380_18285 [Leptospira adleri]PJZ62325.1 hypothetical protein CH376_08990 [Leptospira adleri]